MPREFGLEELQFIAGVYDDLAGEEGRLYAPHDIAGFSRDTHTGELTIKAADEYSKPLRSLFLLQELGRQNLIANTPELTTSNIQKAAKVGSFAVREAMGNEASSLANFKANLRAVNKKMQKAMMGSDALVEYLRQLFEVSLKLAPEEFHHPDESA
jgi:hypothetical protein